MLCKSMLSVYAEYYFSQKMGRLNLTYVPSSYEPVIITYVDWQKMSCARARG